MARTLTSNRISAIAVAIAAATSALLLVLPTGSYESVSVSTNGATRVERGRTTLLDELDEQGYGLVIALAVPGALAALPLPLARTRLARRARVVAAVLIFAFVVMTGFSIGLFYLPTLLAALVAATID